MSNLVAVSTAATIRPTFRTLTAIVLAIAAAALLGAAPVVGAAPVTAAAAQTIVVTRFDDPAPNRCTPTDCSLREAVIRANNAPGSTVVLGTGTYTLTIPGADASFAEAKYGDLDVRVATTFRGAGVGKTIIQAGPTPATGIHRLFDVFARPSALFTNMTIQNGRDVESNTGGCIRNIGIIILDTVLVKGCSSARGGGGISSYGNMTIRNSTITGNTVYNPAGERVSGGGISGGPGTLVSPSSVTIINTLISNNTVSSAGNVDLFALGGGFANTATMNITDSTISGNSAANVGGGINVGDMTITRSTFIGNRARYDVGGVDNDTRMTINDSTFTGNQSGVGCVAVECNRSFAGGVLNTAGGTMYLNNSTISGNTCKVSGGGILNARGLLVVSSSTIVGNTCRLGAGLSASDTTRVQNTIIAANTPTDPVGHGGDCSGRVDSMGYNLIQDKRGCLIAGDTTGNIMGRDPLVGVLKNNGGRTATMALSPNSPAVNNGAPNGCRNNNGALMPKDQRGATRIKDRCDIGAFELP